MADGVAWLNINAFVGKANRQSRGQFDAGRAIFWSSLAALAPQRRRPLLSVFGEIIGRRAPDVGRQGNRPFIPS
jgi:hypothetical protein